MRTLNAVAWMLAVGIAACAAPADPGSPGGAAKAAAPLPPAASRSLVGTRWKGVIAGAADERHLPWLEFVAVGRVSGYTGCNLLNGAWSEEGGRLRVGPLVTTKRGCMGPEGDIERRVLAVLNGQATGTREGAKLVFAGPDGAKLEFVEAR
jgi:heat shock protein HslJ